MSVAPAKASSSAAVIKSRALGKQPASRMGYKRGRTIMRHSNVRLPRQLANPIDLPGLAAIRRKRLFHARRMRRNVEPLVAHQNRAAFEVLLMKKFPVLAVESAHHGRSIKRSTVEIDKIDAPLPGCGIVKPQRLRLDVKGFVGAGDIKLFEVGIAVEEFVVIGNSVILHPYVGVVEPVRQAPNMRLPVTDQEVKIVRAVALRQ